MCSFCGVGRHFLRPYAGGFFPRFSRVVPYDNPCAHTCLKTFTFVEQCVVFAVWDAISSGLMPGGFFPRFSRVVPLVPPCFSRGRCLLAFAQALPCPPLAPSALLIKQAVHGAFTFDLGFGLFFCLGSALPYVLILLTLGVFRRFATCHPSGLKPRPIVFSIKLGLGL